LFLFYFVSNLMFWLFWSWFLLFTLLWCPDANPLKLFLNLPSKSLLSISLALSLSSSQSEDQSLPRSPTMEYSFGGRPTSRHPIAPPRSSTFVCLNAVDSVKDPRRFSVGLRHFPAHALAVVGMSPTGDTWESPPQTPPPAGEGEDEAGVSGGEEEECKVPLLGRLATG